MNLIMNFILKEFLQFRRNKRMFFVIIFAPVVQLLFLGYAANLDIKNIRTGVWDMDRSVSSRELLRKFEMSGYFSLDRYVSSYDELTSLIDNGEVLMGIVIPSDFEKDINRSRTADVQMIYTVPTGIRQR